MSSYISPIANDALVSLCNELKHKDVFSQSDYERFDVHRGLRNHDGSGVMAGLTKVCSVEGYYINDGERVPKEGKLIFRGVNMEDIVRGCRAEGRFGFEEVARLLLFGTLPSSEQLDAFRLVLSAARELPEDFIEDMIMKAPSPNIMNKIERSVLALYSYDSNPDDTSVENVLRQSIQLLAQLPTIMAYAYQVKRRHYYKKSMYIHPINPAHSTAEAILQSIRSDRKFTREEAQLLDMCLMLHAEHGGGNNSTFATRVLTSTGTDTYSAIAAGIGSLKGPRHGGANLKVMEMLTLMKESGVNPTDEGAVADYLTKIINREAGDGSGLIYGMGHAVYTLSDPREKLLKEAASTACIGTPFEEDFAALSLIERLTPEVFSRAKGDNKKICANVDLYSGLIYRILRIPEDLYTPLFAVARTAGWTAHRVEELLTGGKVIRPAYKSMALPLSYVPLSKRKNVVLENEDGRYIPVEERM